MILVAKTLLGLEKILAKEIKDLGFKNIEISNRAVIFHTNIEGLYKANMMLRTATQILLHIKSFSILNSNDVYKYSTRIKWHEIFDISKTFSVSSTVNSNLFNHSNYPSLLLKDAIVDYFRKIKNKRPSVETKNPDIKINIHIQQNLCNISLDSSGELLYKRGYRKDVSYAPINEVLAAGIIKITGWRSEIPFFDPMCGSGTFLIESAMIANKISANMSREQFGFCKWKNFNQKLFLKIKNDLKKIVVDSKAVIYGSDIQQRNIRKCRKNINSNFKYNFIKVRTADFFDCTAKEKTVVIFNPPFDERLKIKENFYQNIGTHLKHNFVGCDVWILYPKSKEKKFEIGLKPTKKVRLVNGGKECFLGKFEIFQGKLKNRY